MTHANQTKLIARMQRYVNVLFSYFTGSAIPPVYVAMAVPGLQCANLDVVVFPL